MGGIACEDATEEVGRFAVFGHSTAGSVGDGDDAVDVGVGSEKLWSKVGSDAAGDGSRTVDGGKNANVIAGGDTAVGTNDAVEGGNFRGVKERCGAGFGTDGVVAFKITGNEIVCVDVLADGNRLGGKADDLVELAHRLTGCDGANCEFVARGDVGERCKIQIEKDLTGVDGLERHRDVVRASEHEGL